MMAHSERPTSYTSFFYYLDYEKKNNFGETKKVY